MKDLNSHVKSDKIKWVITGIALLLIIVMLAGITASIITETNPKDWFTKKTSDIVKEDVSNSIDVEIENSPRVLLAQGETYAVTASNEEYVEVTLTATVLPEDAFNKAVDWKIEWSTTNDDNQDKNVEDYATITPQSDGSNVAVCRIKDLIGALKITVTTREGGFSAKCNIFGGTRVYRLDSVSANASYWRKGADGEYIDKVTTVELANEAGFYNMPLIATTGGTGANTSSMIGYYFLYFKGRFGKTNCYYGSDFKINVKYSDGTTVQGSDFDYGLMVEETQADYARTTLKFGTNFETEYKNKLKTNSNIHLVIEFYSEFYKKVIGTLKVKFYVPTKSISMTDTQIEL